MITTSQRPVEIGESNTGSRFMPTFWLACTFAGIILCYLPVLLVDFGFGEDFRLLAFYVQGATRRTLMIAEGRPINALISGLLFPHVNSIDALAAVRLLYVCIIAAGGVLLARAWHFAGASDRDAALIAIAMCTLPAFQMFAASAAMGSGATAVFLANASGLLLLRAQDTGLRRVLLWVASWATLSAAFLIYQPGAMMYAVVVAIVLVGGRLPEAAFRRIALTSGVVALGGLTTAFAAHRWGVATFGDLLSPGRSLLAAQPVAKLSWFAQYPLVDALNLWNLLPSRFFTAVVGLACLAGLLVHLSWQGKINWLRFGVAALLVPFTYLPSLAAEESWPSYRSQVALVSLVLTYLVIAVRTPAVRKRHRLAVLALVSLAAWGSASAFHNSAVLFAWPLSRELAAVRARLALVPVDVNVVGVIPARFEDSLAPLARYDEFGRAFTSLAWGAVDLPYLVLRERSLNSGREPVDVLNVEGRNENVRDIIDWGKVLREAR